MEAAMQTVEEQGRAEGGGMLMIYLTNIYLAVILCQGLFQVLCNYYLI